MGHYAAELQCDTCGMLHCQCPPKPIDEKLDHFVVDSTFAVCTGHEYLERRLWDWSAPLYFQYKEKFKKREDAEVGARVACEAAVEAARIELARLKKICKVERPWEKK